MKNIIPAIATVLAIGISSWYFTAQPSVQAATPTPEIDPREDPGTMLTIMFRRLDAVEKKVGVKVPKDLDVIQFVPEDKKK